VATYKPFVRQKLCGNFPKRGTYRYIVPVEDGGEDLIRYALFRPDGGVAASTADNAELPDGALHGTYTYINSPIVRSFHPIVIDGAARYTLMIQIDDINNAKPRERNSLSKSRHNRL
jgi:hypothetical protein